MGRRRKPITTYRSRSVSAGSYTSKGFSSDMGSEGGANNNGWVNDFVQDGILVGRNGFKQDDFQSGGGEPKQNNSQSGVRDIKQGGFQSGGIGIKQGGCQSRGSDIKQGGSPNGGTDFKRKNASYSNEGNDLAYREFSDQSSSGMENIGGPSYDRRGDLQKKYSLAKYLSGQENAMVMKTDDFDRNTLEGTEPPQTIGGGATDGLPNMDARSGDGSKIAANEKEYLEHAASENDQLESVVNRRDVFEPAADSKDGFGDVAWHENDWKPIARDEDYLKEDIRKPNVESGAYSWDTGLASREHEGAYPSGNNDRRRKSGILPVEDEAKTSDGRKKKRARRQKEFLPVVQEKEGTGGFQAPSEQEWTAGSDSAVNHAKSDGDPTWEATEPDFFHEDFGHEGKQSSYQKRLTLREMRRRRREKTEEDGFFSDSGSGKSDQAADGSEFGGWRDPPDQSGQAGYGRGRTEGSSDTFHSDGWSKGDDDQGGSDRWRSTGDNSEWMDSDKRGESENLSRSGASSRQRKAASRWNRTDGWRNTRDDPQRGRSGSRSGAASEWEDSDGRRWSKDIPFRATYDEWEDTQSDGRESGVTRSVKKSGKSNPKPDGRGAEKSQANRDPKAGRQWHESWDAGDINGSNANRSESDKNDRSSRYKARDGKERPARDFQIDAEDGVDFCKKKTQDDPRKTKRGISQNARAVIKEPIRIAAAHAKGALHDKLAELEEGNSAVEALHKGELASERTLDIAREWQYRRAAKRQRKKSSIRGDNRNDYGFSTGRHDNTKTSSSRGFQTGNEFSAETGRDSAKVRKRKRRKQIQKSRIKRAYQQARGKGTAATSMAGYARNVQDAAVMVSRRLQETAQKHAAVLASGLVLGILLLVVMVGFSSCGVLFGGVSSMVMAGTYLSGAKEIDAAELLFTELEKELQETVDRVEADNPGYDRYDYNIGEIGHNPFTLISYLSAKYTEFTLTDVEGEIRELFAECYELTLIPGTEEVIRGGSGSGGQAEGMAQTDGSGGDSGLADSQGEDSTQMDSQGEGSTQADGGGEGSAQADGQGEGSTQADGQGGNTQVNEIDVLRITLTVTPLETVVARRMDSGQSEQYALYTDTAGGLQMFDSPLDLDWYRYVSSFYGYRKNTETGRIELHRGLDLAVPVGTDVFAGNSGTAATGYDDHYGYYVSITDEKGYVTKYAHLQSVDVAVGQRVGHGERIGKTGNSGSTVGSKLHIECMYGGEYYNPIFYFDTGEGTLYGETGSSGTGGIAGINVGDGIPPQTYDDATVQRIFDEGEKYLGMPYTFGGTPPASFDCSAFVCWVFSNSHVKNIPRTTAQALYDMSDPVPVNEAKAGDLIFFTGTYNAGRPVTHVGIYCGNGTMLHCGDPIKYSSINTAYWQSHFYAFGRIPLDE